MRFVPAVLATWRVTHLLASEDGPADSMWVIAWLALSGGACLLERLGEKPIVIEHGLQRTQGDDDVLR